MPAHHPAITAADLVRSPAWLPLEVLSAQAIRFVHLNEAAYREASFLDQRLLQADRAHASLAPALVQAAAAQLAPRLHYVFHIGHVGSTLISRLIGAQQSFFALREPALLRAAAEGGLKRGALDAALPLPGLLGLLARSWRPSQRAVVKVTSFVSELAAPLLAMSDSAAALFMFAEPLAYLRTIFAGPNSRAESRILAPLRLGRLLRRLRLASWSLDPRSEGEQVAMSWLCEMTCLQQAALELPAQVLWVNFDRFLGAPAAGLEAIFQRLGARPPASELAALASGPIMQRYSKAPEHAYDAHLRGELLQQADRDHAAEIRRALAWLATVATQHPAARAVLESVERLHAAA